MKNTITKVTEIFKTMIKRAKRNISTDTMDVLEYTFMYVGFSIIGAIFGSWLNSLFGDKNK